MTTALLCCFSPLAMQSFVVDCLFYSHWPWPSLLGKSCATSTQRNNHPAHNAALTCISVAEAAALPLCVQWQYNSKRHGTNPNQQIRNTSLWHSSICKLTAAPEISMQTDKQAKMIIFLTNCMYLRDMFKEMFVSYASVINMWWFQLKKYLKVDLKWDQ